VKKFVPSLIFASLLLIAISCVPGCSAVSTVEDRYITAQDAYIFAVETVTDSYESGDIDPKDWKEIILPAILEGDALLDIYKSYADGGDVPQETTDALNRILATLKPFVLRLVEDKE